MPGVRTLDRYFFLVLGLYSVKRNVFLFTYGLLCLYRKGDYFRYLAEFKTDEERKEAAEQSLKGYEACILDLIKQFIDRTKLIPNLHDICIDI